MCGVPKFVMEYQTPTIKQVFRVDLKRQVLSSSDARGETILNLTEFICLSDLRLLSNQTPRFLTQVVLYGDRCSSNHVHIDHWD